MSSQVSFKQKIYYQLQIAAKQYSFFLNKKIILRNNKFKNRKEYVLRFYETNFLHLTGVITKLSAWDFFKKCFNGTLKQNEFEVKSKVSPQIKGYIRLKMKNLVTISNLFDKTILVQENFKKNCISCLIATSDGKKTLGFVDAKYVARPITLLDRNHLDAKKPIFKVIAKVVEIRK